jgi:hypothetical protein
VSEVCIKKKSMEISMFLPTLSLFVNERPNIFQEIHLFDSKFGIFLTCTKVLNLSSSVVARYPAPEPDPALFASGFQDANKKCFFFKDFLLITF